MSTSSVLSVTLGCPGAGKTYCRVRWLVTDFLVNNPTGLYITNIALNIEAISSDLSVRLGCAPDAIKNRLVVIDDEILLSWEKLNQLSAAQLKLFDNTNFPPSQFFQRFDLSGAHIAIDEFHKYFGKKSPRPLRALWNDWFAEIRKTGCVFEAITQNYNQLNSEYIDKCSIRTELINHSSLRDPFFGIPVGDWYELRAGLFNRSTIQKVTVRETMQGCSNSGRLRWIPTGKDESFFITPDFFKYYDSFRNSTGSSGTVITPHQRYGRRVIFWFLRVHFLRLFSRFILVCLFLWFTLFGGFSFCFGRLIYLFSVTSQQNLVKYRGKAAAEDPGKDPGKAVAEDPGKDPGKAAAEDPGKDPGKFPVKDFKPVLFFEDYVVLSNGYKLKKGDLINGVQVVEINRAGRFFVLSDGSRLSM